MPDSTTGMAETMIDPVTGEIIDQKDLAGRLPEQAKEQGVSLIGPRVRVSRETVYRYFWRESVPAVLGPGLDRSRGPVFRGEQGERFTGLRPAYARFCRLPGGQSGCRGEWAGEGDAAKEPAR